MMSMRSPTALRILANGSKRGLELGRRDVPSAGAFGGDVKGPDLHAGDALVEERMGELVGAMQKPSRSS